MNTHESVLPAPRPAVPTAQVHAVTSGEWVAPDVLHMELLSAWRAGESPSIATAGCDHLPGSILQVLLSWFRQPAEDGAQRLRLTQVSPGLAHWFTLAGAGHLLPFCELEQQA